MNNKDFHNLFSKVTEEETNILITKNEEYSKKDYDKLNNFKSTAKDLNVDPKKVCYVFLKKHLDSIATYIKQGRVQSEEKIEGRIADARNYLFFLRALIEDEKHEY